MALLKPYEHFSYQKSRLHLDNIPGASNFTESSRITSTTPIETEYNLFYEPDIYNPPGSYVNDFKDIPDLIEYIEEQIQDVYLERNEFQDTHFGKDGQILDIATMTIRNAHNEEMDVKLFDRHLSRTQIRYELRQQLERIKEIFDHTEP